MPIAGVATYVFKSDGLEKTLSDIDKGKASWLGLGRDAAAVAAGVVAGFVAMKAASAAWEAAISFKNTAAMFETMNVSLKSVTGSSENAEKAMAWITTFAAKTPLELENTTKSFLLLKNFGIDPMNGSLQAIVDQTAKFGGSAEMMDGIIRGLGQAWTKGKLQAEEMNQMIERGVPVYDLLGKALGKTTSEIMDMSKAGAIGRAEMSLFIAEMGRSSAGAAQAQMQTWTGMISNMSDNWTLFQKQVMDAGVFEFLKAELSNVLAKVNEMAASGELERYARQISEFAKTALTEVKEIVTWLWANRDLAVGLFEAIATGIDYANVAFISLMDVAGTVWIEVKNAGSEAWAAVQDAAGNSFSGILSGLETLISGMATAYNAIGDYDMGGAATRAAMEMRVAIRGIDEWSTNLEKAIEIKESELEAHNKIIDAMVSEQAGYSGTAKASMESALKSRSEAQKTATAIIAQETKKTEAVKALSEKETKAREKALDKAIKDEFAFLDEREKAIDKAYKQTVKEHEEMLKEIARLESDQINEFKKTLDDSRDAYEEHLKDTLGIKEISAESMAEIDQEYARIFAEVSEGQIDSFNESMTAILDGKQLTTEQLMENDALYSAFLREQETANREIRLEFYSQSGQFSQEYYDSEIERINSYTERLRAAGVDAVSVEREKTDQLIALNLKKAESSDSFFAGMSAGWLKSQQDMTTWADVGRQAYESFESGLSTSFATLINSTIKGDMEGLRGAWDSLWQGMLDQVVNVIAQMAAEWAAQQITSAALGAASWIADSFETGVFDYQPGPGSQPSGDGGFLSVLHPGETVLPADLTTEFKNAVGWEEAKATVLNYFGITPDQNTAGIFDTVGDYSASGAALWNAWNAFRDGDNTAGSIALANAFEEGLATYAEQNASIMAGGLGSAAGAIGSGIGAWQSFQNDDYFQGSIQALQAIQQGITAYETIVGAGAGAGSSAAGAGAGAGAGASGIASTLGSVLEGAGWGAAVYSIFSMIAGDEHMQSSLASTGATVGAGIGTIIYPGAGSIAGAFVGGLIGTVADVASGPSARFEIDDLNDPINSARTWTSDGWAGTLPIVSGDTGSAHGNARNAYLQATQTSMDIATATIAAATQMLGPELGAQFQSVFAANLDQASAGELSWQVGEEGRGANTAARLAGTYWNDTMDAIRAATLAVGGGGRSVNGRWVTGDVLPGLAEWATENMLPDDIVLDPTGRAQAEWAAELDRAERERRDAERMATGGAATGGVVVPAGEDGILGVQKYEGILPIPALKWAEDIGNAIKSGTGPFGGTFAEFDKPIEQQRGQEITVTFPEDAGRSAVFSELYLSDAVELLGRILTSLEQISEINQQIAGTNQDIAEKPLPSITNTELVGFVAPGLESEAATGRRVFNSPDVIRAAGTINNRFGNLGW